MAFYGAIRFRFEFEDTLCTNDIFVMRARAKRPSTIGHKGIKFMSHGSTPLRTRSCLGETCEFRWIGKCNKGSDGMSSGIEGMVVRISFWFEGPCLRTSLNSGK